MFKKTTFIFAALTANLLAAESDGFNTDKFNPENSTFSKMETLNTWVASHHQSNGEKMKELQRNVAMEVPENDFSLNWAQPISNNPGDNRYFGKTFPTLKSIQLPFLQFVHEISQVKNPIVLEIACSMGLVTWKVPYSFENSGTVYANELSSVMLNGNFNVVINARCKGDNLDNLIHKIPGSCFNIISDHPELIGQVDAIYVQNLEHFFNPDEHQEFLKLLSTLLTKNGRAFLASHTIVPESVKTQDAVYKLYIQNKQTVIYPGFMTYMVTCNSLESGAIVGAAKLAHATTPNDSTPCNTVTKNKTFIGFGNTPTGAKKIFRITQEVTSQFFTPTIYKNSIVPHPSLKMVKSFFMDKKGNEFEKFADGEATHAVAILEKID